MANNAEVRQAAIVFPVPDANASSTVREALLEKINANDNLPALGSSVSKVVQLASSDDEAVRNLAHFIMSDVGLTQKILRMANAACYRSTGASPITTISKAIFLLGFDTVKTSALGMLLVDRMPGKMARDVRRELLLALNASILGRELARRSQVRDGEEAAIAALFKNMGPLLVAAHDHALYRDIQLAEEQGLAAEKAALKVMGCTYTALAESVMQQWDIPESIILAMGPLPGGNVKPAKNRQEWIQQVAAFSAQAALLLMKPENTDTDAAALIGRYGLALNLDQTKFAAMLATVSAETQALAQQLKLEGAVSEARPASTQHVASLWGMLENDHWNETENLYAHDAGLPAELLLTMEKAPDLTQVTACHPSGKPLNARDLLFAGVQDVTEVMASGRSKVNDLFMLVLETIYRGMGFRFATVCLKDIKTNQFRARISLGENNEARQARFAFSAVATRDLFQLSMSNDADLLISDALDPKIRNLLPLWHRQLLPDARSFIVLPLVVQKKPLGLFYADRALPAMEGVAPDETAMIKMLKGQVIAALNPR